MSAFDWSMTRWYKTHATGWLLCNVTGGLYVAIHVKRRQSQSALHLIWRTEDVFFENKNQASQ